MSRCVPSFTFSIGYCARIGDSLNQPVVIAIPMCSWTGRSQSIEAHTTCRPGAPPACHDVVKCCGNRRLRRVCPQRASERSIPQLE